MMKFSCKLLLAVPLLALSCASIPVEGNGFFNPDELALLDKTTQAIDYGYGYDADEELNYIFSISMTGMNDTQKEKAFTAVVKDIPSEQFMRFYMKIYRLHAMTRYVLHRHKNEKEWKEYTYVKNYLYPPLDSYFAMIEKNLIAHDPASAHKRPSIKKKIDTSVVLYYRELEKEKERVDY